MAEYSIVGQPTPWLDAGEKAAGKAVYAGDVVMPGMLHAKVLRSSIAHGKVLNIDYSRALKLPGVKAVVTAQDVPAIRFGNFNNMVKDRTLLARDKVRHIGEPIAAIAAEDEDLAREALDLIKVDYQELSPLFDPLEAMEPDSPLIHEEIDNYEAIPGIIKYGNVCALSVVKGGNVEIGFKEADFVFEDTFQTQSIHQGFIEPSACVAAVEPSGKVTVWTSGQGVFHVKAALCQVLGLASSQVRVICAKVGGSFGGKGQKMELKPLSVLLAQKTKRPVRMVMERKEEFVTTGARHPSFIFLKTGVKKDGTITARQARLVFDTGAYADFGPAVASESAQQIRGPYGISHYRFDSYAVYTNKPSRGCCRAHGAPQPTFAYESQMDIIATELKMDPIELRLKNGLKSGDTDSLGRELDHINLVETLSEAALWMKKKRQGLGPGRGLGMALGSWHTGGRASSAVIRLNEDGTVTALIGAPDVTGSNTIVAQIVAEELGVSLNQISISPIDSDVSPYDAGSSGSRVTYNLGNAIKGAAAEVKDKLINLASLLLEANPADLETKDGRVQVKGSPEKNISLAELSRISHHRRGGPILGSGSFMGIVKPYDPKRVEGLVFLSSSDQVIAVQAAEVEVDRETGDIKVAELATFHDIGFAINPMAVEGQAEGGAVQALGFALSEEILFEEGKPVNASLRDYGIPNPVDAPHVQAFLIQDKKGVGPYGAKGMGELPVIPTAAAIANAIADAIGVRIKELPITPEKVLRAIGVLGGRGPAALSP